MTKSEFSLSVSNAALSSLLFDCCNNDCDRVGLFIGKMSHTTETVITDTQEPSSEKQVTSDILSTMPLSLFSFYDAVGDVDQEMLREITGNLREQVVGWYICRRNSRNSLYLREYVIDAQLRTLFADVDKTHFIVGIVTEFKDENDSTLEVQYTFFTRNGNNFIPVKVEVDNLAKTGINFRKSSSVISRFDLFGRINPNDAFKISMPKFIAKSQGDISIKFYNLVSDLHDSQQEIMELKKKLEKLQPQPSSDCQPLKSELNDRSYSSDHGRSSPILNSKLSDTTMEYYEDSGDSPRHNRSHRASQEF